VALFHQYLYTDATKTTVKKWDCESETAVTGLSC